MPPIDAPAGPQAGWDILDRVRFSDRRPTIGIAISALLAIALVGAFAAWFANDSLKRRYPAPGAMVSIGTGTHRLHFYCTGSGGPVVMIESGIGSGWETWGAVVTELAHFSRVCVYDRSGYGWSEPEPESGPDAATAPRLADEFRSLLLNGPVPGPYILVAHSFGAYIARIYADRFRGDLLGMVLVDPSHEDEGHLHSMYRTFRNLIPPSGIPALRAFIEGDRALPPFLKAPPALFRRRFFVGLSDNQAVASRRELASLDASEAAVRSAHFPRDLPLIVITATHIVTTGDARKPEMPNPPRHFELQASLAKLSSQGRQIVVHSGHLVQLDQPDAIVRAVRELISCCRP
jgi:pimeloyl-ACP methyl ester carboxylesterase